MADEDKIEEGVEFRMEMLTDRRVLCHVAKTIKLMTKENDYSKFTLGIEGTIPDGVKHKSALDTMFRELMMDAAIKEAAIRVAHENPQMVDKLVMLLKDLLAMSGSGTPNLAEVKISGDFPI
jgi:hypothetical protein